MIVSVGVNRAYITINGIMQAIKICYLRDLNNWWGIMLLDATSKIIPMIVNSRLQRHLKRLALRSWRLHKRVCSEVPIFTTLGG
jgi:hypothetical protein